MTIYENTYQNEKGYLIGIKIVSEHGDAFTVFSRIYYNINKGLGPVEAEVMFDGEVVKQLAPTEHRIAYPDISRISFDESLDMLYIHSRDIKETFAFACDEQTYNIIRERLKESNNNINESLLRKASVSGEFIDNVGGIILLIIILCGIFLWIGSNDSNQWNSLTEEEQEWYEDNYGNGKMDDINDAIDDYKNK